jgi:hypothetical protein
VVVIEGAYPPLPVVGEDSMQALVLAMRYLEFMVRHISAGRRVLDEAGSALPLSLLFATRFGTAGPAQRSPSANRRPSPKPRSRAKLSM